MSVYRGAIYRGPLDQGVDMEHTMHEIYTKAREDYIIVLDNMQELIAGARDEHVAYYLQQHKVYKKKLAWVCKKLDKTWN